MEIISSEYFKFQKINKNLLDISTYSDFGTNLIPLKQTTFDIKNSIKITYSLSLCLKTSLFKTSL